MATGNSQDTVSVLVNKVGGSFQARLDYAAGGGSIEALSRGALRKADC